MVTKKTKRNVEKKIQKTEQKFRVVLTYDSYPDLMVADIFNLNNNEDLEQYREDGNGDFEFDIVVPIREKKDKNVPLFDLTSF